MIGEEHVSRFRQDVDERLGKMIDVLLAVERGAPPDDAVPRLFRDAHSIKGTAGMMGYDDVYAIADAFEHRLAQARETGSLDSALVGPMLDVLDALRAAVEGAPGVGPSALAVAADDAAPPEPSHAGRAPAAEPEPRAIRMDAGKVDRLLDAVGETVVHHRRLEHAVAAVDPSGDLVDRSELLLGELRDAVIQLRTLPFSAITGQFPRVVRDVAAATGKDAELIVEGADTQLDRLVLDGATEMVGHLLRNAVAHGIEPPDERGRSGKTRVGRVTLGARQRSGRVAITVSDDGGGVAAELLERARDGRSLVDVLADPGVSTAASVTRAAGRGVGLDAVRAAVEALGGELEIATEPGRGTEVTMLLPLSLAVAHVLVVQRADVLLGIPMPAVMEVVAVDDGVSLRGEPALTVRDEPVGLVDSVVALGGSVSALAPRSTAVVVAAGGRRVALACDTVIGEEEVVVKPLGAVLAGVPGYLGAAVLADGRVALILDAAHVAAARPVTPPSQRPAQKVAEPKPATVLVVDDQFTVRELQRSILETAGYRVLVARDGREAWEMLRGADDVDLVVTDIEMPQMDGLELLGAVRRSPDRSSLPVVVVTSRSDEDDERRGLEAGADAYLVKHRFDQRVLLDTVARLVAR